MMLENLTYLIPVAGFVALIIGLAAMVQPLKMSRNFGIEIQGNALAYVIGLGVRDVFIGGALIVFFYINQIKASAVLIFLLAIVAISDFLVVRKFGSKLTSRIHLAGAVFLVLLGVGLLFVKSQ